MIYRIGIVLCVLLAIFDVISIGSVGSDDGPPSWAAVLGLVLGVVTFAGMYLMRRGQDSGLPIVIGSRVLSSLSAIPAYIADDHPDWGMVAIVAGAVTAIAVALVYAGRSGATSGGARRAATSTG